MPPLIACSNRADGTMLDKTLGDRHAESIVAHRRSFCKKSGVDYDECVYQIISYDATQTYDKIEEVSSRNTTGVHADVLYTETAGLGLFLPIADCVGTVLYDEARGALALAHLGRHASVAKTMQRTITYFVAKGSHVNDIKIWMTPSVKKQHYVLEYFDYINDSDWKNFAEATADGIHLNLQGFNTHLAVSAGVLAKNIEVSPIDTAVDPDYFSHSQGDVAGRFAVLAMMK